MKLDVLIRTSKRKTEGKSPQQQRDICQSCAASNGYELVKIHDSNGDESGKTMARPSVERALERIRSGETDGVIVAFLDRFGRAPIEEAMTVVREIHSAGGVLVPADAGGVPINPDDPQAETNLVLQLQMARQYWSMTANRFKLSQADAIKRGAYIGPAPLGYRRRADAKLEPDPATAQHVTRAFQIAAADSVTAAMSYLDEHVPSECGRDTARVRRMLANEAYLGHVVHATAGRKDDAHTALTDLATWTAAQQAPRFRRPANTSYLLTNIATCSVCGAGLVGQLQSVPGRKDTYRRYRCGARGAERGHVSVKAEALERHVRDELRDVLGDARIRIRSGAAGLTEAEAALRAAKAARKQFAEDTEIRNILGDEDWRAGAVARSKAVDDAQHAYEKAASAAVSRDLPAADELDDDAALLVALGAMVQTVRVHPGRGAIDGRAEILFDEFD
jgi:DNA invertase Pin-like site-specific DNA recombinase